MELRKFLIIVHYFPFLVISNDESTLKGTPFTKRSLKTHVLLGGGKGKRAQDGLFDTKKKKGGE